jgi:hypothetical protein
MIERIVIYFSCLSLAVRHVDLPIIFGFHPRTLVVSAKISYLRRFRRDERRKKERKKKKQDAFCRTARLNRRYYELREPSPSLSFSLSPFFFFLSTE